MRYSAACFRISCKEESVFSAARDVLVNELASVGFESFEDSDNGTVGYVPSEILDSSEIENIVSNFFLPDVEIQYSITDMEDKDWNETWENAGFEPIAISDEVTVYDAKHTKQPVDFCTPINIGIEAKQAFGTGTHQTTRMVISTLLNLDLKGKRLLDCGCGTGILSIAASKLGAKEVVGYDIDEWSVNNTKHNAALNDIDNLEVYHGDVGVLSHINGIFDIVVANINRNILLADMPAFKEAMLPNAILVISGFYEDDAPRLVARGRGLGLTEINRRTEEGWCCLVFK